MKRCKGVESKGQGQFEKMTSFLFDQRETQISKLTEKKICEMGIYHESVNQIPQGCACAVASKVNWIEVAYSMQHTA